MGCTRFSASVVLCEKDDAPTAVVAILILLLCGTATAFTVLYNLDRLTCLPPALRAKLGAAGATVRRRVTQHCRRDVASNTPLVAALVVLCIALFFALIIPVDNTITVADNEYKSCVQLLCDAPPLTPYPRLLLVATFSSVQLAGTS